MELSCLLCLQAFAMGCHDLCPVLGEALTETHVVSKQCISESKQAVNNDVIILSTATDVPSFVQR